MNSKVKGGRFEREVCKLLSRWVSHGKSEDLFWRSAMSGGRATVSHKRGGSVRQAGDICAVAPEGHALTDHVYIECKHVANLAIPAFLLTGRGDMAAYWRLALHEARKRGKTPMLVAQQNRLPTLVLLPTMQVDHHWQRLAAWSGLRCSIYLMADLLATPFNPRDIVSTR